FGVGAVDVDLSGAENRRGQCYGEDADQFYDELHGLFGHAEVPAGHGRTDAVQSTVAAEAAAWRHPARSGRSSALGDVGNFLHRSCTGARSKLAARLRGTPRYGFAHGFDSAQWFRRRFVGRA